MPPQVHRASVHVTAAVVRHPKPRGREYNGVCTTFLANRPAGAPVQAFIRHSTFRLPADPRVPIVMVGPGTGFAPFRAFIQERALQQAQHGAEAVGETLLFFGCTHRMHDYIYEEEVAAALDARVLTSLHLAFSREQSQKVYVQVCLRSFWRVAALSLTRARAVLSGR